MTNKEAENDRPEAIEPLKGTPQLTEGEIAAKKQESKELKNAKTVNTVKDFVASLDIHINLLSDEERVGMQNSSKNCQEWLAEKSFDMPGNFSEDDLAIIFRGLVIAHGKLSGDLLQIGNFDDTNLPTSGKLYSFPSNLSADQLSSFIVAHYKKVVDDFDFSRNTGGIGASLELGDDDSGRLPTTLRGLKPMSKEKPLTQMTYAEQKAAIEIKGGRIASLEETVSNENFQEQGLGMLLNMINQQSSRIYREKKGAQGDTFHITQQELEKIKPNLTIQVTGSQWYQGDSSKILESSGLAQNINFTNNELLTIINGQLELSRIYDPEIKLKKKKIAKLPKLNIPQGTIAEQKKAIIDYYKQFLT